MMMLFSASAEGRGFMEWVNNLLSEKILFAADKVNNGGSAEDMDVIVEDYFHLIRCVHGDEKPEHVELLEANCAIVIVDGVKYDLYLIPHDDGKNTNRRMEIEILINDDTRVTEIQARLNDYIKENW